MTHLLVCLPAVVPAAPEMALQVQLQSPLSTERNHKGDAVMATVISPDAFKSDLVEGKVTAVKSGNAAILQRHFDGEFERPGNVDEEGRITRKGRNLGKALAGTGAVEQFGIDAARLALKGFGPDQPIGPNDMTEGSAENRRLEFVKQ